MVGERRRRRRKMRDNEGALQKGGEGGRKGKREGEKKKREMMGDSEVHIEGEKGRAHTCCYPVD